MMKLAKRARHARQTASHGRRRYGRPVLSALALATVAGAGTAGILALTPAPAGAAPELSVPASVLVSGETFGIDQTTYAAHPVIRLRFTRGDVRLCRAFATFNAAGIPSDRQIRHLAADATRANGVYLANGEALITGMVAGGSFAGPAHGLIYFCHHPR